MLRTVLIAGTLLLTGIATAAAQPAGKRVKVNGMQMYYEATGQGDPLIVLHGAYMNIPSMGAIIPRLARTHRVYAVELQGHGQNPMPVDAPNGLGRAHSIASAIIERHVDSASR